jgi:hypothetical protein
MHGDRDDECSFYRFYVYDDRLAATVLVLAAVAVAVLAAAAVIVLIAYLLFYILHKEINYF